MELAQTTSSQRNLAIYVHIPFCAKHCAYCDFNTYVEPSASPIVQQTVEAICRDIESSHWLVDSGQKDDAEETSTSVREDGQPQVSGVTGTSVPGSSSVRTTGNAVAPRTGHLSAWQLSTDQREPTTAPISTIFFGGGTPTFLTGEQMSRILLTIRENFEVLPDAEISTEANPGSSDAEKFAILREVGFNRLSVGVQSFDDTLLVALDRFHTAGEAECALKLARDAGFTNLNLDLMFGLPKQNLPLWRQSLERAIALQTEHLSLYALTLEAGTRFERMHAGGKLELPDEDTELAMYEEAISLLTSAGYEHYEVSNFAKPGYRCRHNLTYWHNEEYLGFGPGAVSYMEGVRWKRERLPARYIAKVRDSVDLTVESERLAPEGTLGETMMLGLRLRDGLPLSRIRTRFGIEPLEHFAPEIARLSERGLLTLQEDTLRLTHTGLLLANDVLSAFLPEEEEAAE